MSPPDSDWVTVAVLGKTRGNRGELTAFPLSKPERFEELHEVFLFGSGERFAIESTWFHQGTLVFKFAGIESISDAEKLSGFEVRVPIGQRTALDEGEFFQSDLIGCEVIDRKTGESCGRVRGWKDGGGSGLLELEDGLLIPFVKAICVGIDPARKRIEVELPEGLKDLNRS